MIASGWFDTDSSCRWYRRGTQQQISRQQTLSQKIFRPQSASCWRRWRSACTPDRFCTAPPITARTKHTHTQTHKHKHKHKRVYTQKYAHTRTHRHRNTHAHIDTYQEGTDTQTHRHIETQTHRQKTRDKATKLVSAALWVHSHRTLHT